MNPREALTNAAARVGDKLILTKPIGTGVITTAIKKDAAPAEVIARAVESMTTLNGPAAEAAKRVGCHACTDVTGFSLLGHLHEMTAASGVGARVRLGDVPVFEGVGELLEQDLAPGGTYSNMDFLDSEGHVQWDETLSEGSKLLLCDPQTAGGLLLSVDPDRADDLRRETRRRRDPRLRPNRRNDRRCGLPGICRVRR